MVSRKIDWDNDDDFTKFFQLLKTKFFECVIIQLQIWRYKENVLAKMAKIWRKTPKNDDFWWRVTWDNAFLAFRLLSSPIPKWKIHNYSKILEKLNLIAVKLSKNIYFDCKNSKNCNFNNFWTTFLLWAFWTVPQKSP